MVCEAGGELQDRLEEEERGLLQKKDQEDYSDRITKCEGIL